MIFVDSNVPMSLVGSPHRHKLDAQRLLERCISERIALVTDAGGLQEIVQTACFVALPPGHSTGHRVPRHSALRAPRTTRERAAGQAR